MTTNTVEVKCKECNHTYKFQATDVQLAAYYAGAHIQDTFRFVPADIREVLISGMCGKCFDKMFEGME